MSQPRTVLPPSPSQTSRCAFLSSTAPNWLRQCVLLSLLPSPNQLSPDGFARFKTNVNDAFADLDKWVENPSDDLCSLSMASRAILCIYACVGVCDYLVDQECEAWVMYSDVYALSIDKLQETTFKHDDVGKIIKGAEKFMSLKQRNILLKEIASDQVFP